MVTEERSAQLQSGREIAIVGDIGVGKTALLMRLLNRRYQPTDSTPINPSTHFGLQTTQFDGDISIHDVSGDISIRDVAGLTAPNELRRTLRGKLPIVAIVAVDLARSHELPLRYSLLQWLDAFTAAPGQPRKFHRFLVSTREDISYSDSKSDQLTTLARQLLFDKVFRTSAKTNVGIQELRSAILEVVSREDQEREDEAAAPVTLVVRAMAERLCDLVARNPSCLDQIEWRDLERLIAAALSKIGFSVELTRSAKDGGKDVVACCLVEADKKIFYIEIKHWVKGGHPGMDEVTSFVEVNARDATDGGLFLSTSGYTQEVYGKLGEISRQHVKLGEREKITSLCRYYVKQKGVWRSERPLPDLLFEETLA